MNAPRHRCDVAVVGTELAGLAAAALLARRGLRCRVFGHDALGESCALNDVQVARWPFLLSAFEARSAVRQVVEDLGLRQDVRRRLPFAEPPLQLVDGEHRLDLHEESGARLAELRREFGDQAERLDACLHGGDEPALAVTAWLDSLGSLGKRGFWARRSLMRGLQQAPSLDANTMPWHALEPDHPLAEWTRALVPFSCHVGWTDEAPLPTRRAVLGLLQGPRHAPGGERAALADLLRHYIESHGGKVHLDARVQSVELRRGEVSLRLAEQNIEWLSAAIIDAGRGSFADLVASARLQKKIRDDSSVVRHQGGVAAVHRVYRPHALPQALACKALVQTVEQRPVLLHVDRVARPASGEARETETRALVSAATPCAGPWSSADQDFLSQVLDELLPFADEHCLGELAGADFFRPLYADRDAGSTDPLGPRRAIPGPHPLLFRVGCDVLPAWGLEGEMRSAMLACEAIVRRLQKNKKTEHAASAA